MEEAYIYILECADGSLYTGWTNNLARRLQAHNTGHGARCTRARLPVRMVYAERLPDKSTALSREYAVKQLSRAEKLALIAGGSPVPLPGAGDALDPGR